VCRWADRYLSEVTVTDRIKLRAEFSLLKTVPGIGQILALTIMLETGDIKRFSTVGDYASYCRCVGSQKLSNGKKKGSGNTKNGNNYLAWNWVGPHQRVSHRICESYNLGHGVVPTVFWGKHGCQGREEILS